MKVKAFFLVFCITLASAYSSASVCTSLLPYNGTTNDASDVIQGCINNEPSGGTLELPAGKYYLGKSVWIAKPLTFKTAGKEVSMPRCVFGHLHDCAELIASQSSAEGLIGMHSANISVDHLIINGNKAARTNQAGNIYWNCSYCSITNSILENAGASSSLVVVPISYTGFGGPLKKVVMSRNLVAYNGFHNVDMKWADGITVHDCDTCNFTDNEFVDNTDIDLVFGGCRNCIIRNNSIRHTNAWGGACFAAFMIHNWPESWKSSGVYTGAVISDNRIDCGEKKRCGFGLYLGADAWYVTDSYGGSVHDNTVINAQQAVVLDDVHNMEVYNNHVNNYSGTGYIMGTRSYAIDTSKDTLGTVYSRQNWDGNIPNRACTIDCSASSNNAQYVSQNVPTVMVKGRKYNVSVSMRNRGSTTWTAAGNYRLGSQNLQDNTIWGPHRVSLASNEYIEPIDLDVKTFIFEVTAPASAGSYNFQWGMVQDYVEWFGEYTHNVAVQVVDALPNDAQFISQSVPSLMVSGQTYQAYLTMKNIGTNAWTEINNFRLGSQNPQDNHQWNGGRVGLSSVEAIAPGASKTFSYTVTAPVSPGNYNFQWRMVQDYVEWFGENSSNIVVTVITTSTTTTSTTTTTTTTSTTTSTSSSTTTTSTTTSSTSSSSTTTSTSITSSTTASSTTTTQTQCIMPGNYRPCDEVSLSEVVDGIYEWVGGIFGLGEVIDLINSWADPASYLPE